jgi:hypothetical protein
MRLSAIWCAKSGVLLGILSGVLLGGCTPVPEEEQTSIPSEKPEYAAWDQSLVLTSPFPRFVFLPLNNPGVVPAEDASHMEASDLVAGLVVNGQARAYPKWILVAYHVVNDTIGEAPVMLALCEVCSGASAFSPIAEGLEGRTLAFQIHGIARGTFTVYDYQTQTVWSPFTGRTLEGELHPSRIGRLPLMLETWGEWMSRYPDTEVVFGNRRMIETREHGRGEHNEIGDDFIPDGFIQVANMDDTRLAYNALVFGLTDASEEHSAAFPLDFLEGHDGLIRYELAGASYLIKKIGEYAVVALRLPAGTEDRRYHLVSTEPFRVGDDQGSLWDEFGRAVSETAEHRNMETADGYFTEWYEWVSSYPQSEIFAAEEL